MYNSLIPRIDSFAELREKAKKQANKAPPEFQRSIELYYMARYLVAVFEARNHAIPIQVWNEYRNGLDHLFRHLTLGGSVTHEQGPGPARSPDDHLKKLQGHMQRALLDIMKFACHKESIWVEAQKYSPEVLCLVKDGLFSQELWLRRETAERLFIKAKSVDTNLGENAKYNDEVLEKYVEAVFAHERARDYITEHMPAISHAVMEHARIANLGRVDATKKAFVPNVAASIVAAVIFASITYIIGRSSAETPKATSQVQEAQQPLKTTTTPGKILPQQSNSSGK